MANDIIDQNGIAIIKGNEVLYTDTFATAESNEEGVDILRHIFGSRPHVQVTPSETGIWITDVLEAGLSAHVTRDASGVWFVSEPSGLPLRSLIFIGDED